MLTGRKFLKMTSRPRFFNSGKTKASFQISRKHPDCNLCENWEEILTFANQCGWHRIKRAGCKGRFLDKLFNITNWYKSYFHSTELKNKKGSLRLHGCLHVVNFNARYIFSFAWYLQSHAPTSSDGAAHITLLRINLKCQWTHPLPWEIIYILIFTGFASELCQLKTQWWPTTAGYLSSCGKAWQKCWPNVIPNKSKQPCCLNFGNGPFNTDSSLYIMDSVPRESSTHLIQTHVNVDSRHLFLAPSIDAHRKQNGLYQPCVVIILSILVVKLSLKLTACWCSQCFNTLTYGHFLWPPQCPHL